MGILLRIIESKVNGEEGRMVTDIRDFKYNSFNLLNALHRSIGNLSIGNCDKIEIVKKEE